jgi:hypothetical protein
MRLSQSGLRRLALSAVAAAPLVGCGASGQKSDAGPDLADKPPDLISDFEEGRALVLPLGAPARSGFWYSYNDAAASCLQSPAHGDVYYPSTPVVPSGAPSGGRALHASWNACSAWGAGVGADFNRAVPDGGATTAPRVPYDLSTYGGISFWAMATPGTSTAVRAKVVMRISTQIEDGGACDASLLGPNKCGDEWGEVFTLPDDGSWKAVTVRFSDPAFAQEPWGQPFAWNPADVLGIQFQSATMGGLYDFWIDDVSLIR